MEGAPADLAQQVRRINSEIIHRETPEGRLEKRAERARIRRQSKSEGRKA
ncbi:hypothetical protein GL4_1502 [Methyloceanibacter caenitepidi]|uniref:Uncharacterized protein n=2 Tax=Methyloceanibacter caenitepidi TaxID=1384459 RepID=A0A0A8K1X7_9HYPH|nr:hypothetical protein GL4_1502 [Methyloceanibacter caenitepidi]